MTVCARTDLSADEGGGVPCRSVAAAGAPVELPLAAPIGYKWER